MTMMHLSRFQVQELDLEGEVDSPPKTMIQSKHLKLSPQNHPIN
jgi:hypothetical protein